MATETKPFLTPEQYLEIECRAEFKSEYFQGRMFAMSGARQALSAALGDTLLNTTLIVEVLSPPTEVYDRGRKFGHYRSLESLSEYLLICSDRICVDIFTRRADGNWFLRPIRELYAGITPPST